MKRRNESPKIAEDDSDADFSENSDDNELAALAGLRKKKKSKSKEIEEDKEVEETVDEKRIRLTRQYLTSVGVGLDDKEESDDDAAEDDEFGDDAVGKELRKQALRAAGKEVRRTIVNKMNLGFLGEGESQTTERPCISSDDVRIMRAHRLPTTCLALSEDDKFVMSAAKDGSIYQFDIETGKKQCFNSGHKARGHQGAILGLSLSSDSVYLASAGEDKMIRIWDVRAGTLAHTFRNHMDVVSDVAFRKDSLTLFSGSYDRTLKVFDIEQMNYLETLYGHQAPITAIDALYPERAFSVSSDHTLRIWRIATETQLRLVAPNTQLSIDSIAAFSADYFVTGSQDGGLSLWYSNKKRPVDVVSNAHNGTWLSSVAALYATDLCASGAADGYVRFWQAGLANNKLKELYRAPVVGHVNGLAFGQKGRFAVAAVGQEHRFGRWDRIQPARNGVHLINMEKVAALNLEESSDEEAEESEDDFFAAQE